MKLNKLFFALMAVVLPLGFTACGSDDNDEPAPQTPTFVNQDKAARYTFSNSTGVQSVTFGESNSVVIETTNEDGVTEYIVGTYIANGDTYTVSSGSGTWTFKVGSNNDVVVTNPEGVISQVTATKSTATDKSEKTQNILGDWRPKETFIKLKKVTAKNYLGLNPIPGVDFQAIKKAAEAEGCKIEDEFKDDFVVKTVSFYGTKIFNVNFTSNKSYVANWEWYQWPDIDASLKDAGIKFTWKDKDAAENNFIKEGKAACLLKTDGVYKGQLHLTLISVVDASDGQWNVEITFRLIR
ncbi:MAG: hypothetical protein J6I36_11665 [Bacteroidaceae bacterium]|nr:hypothetical protein [Bacteroidaceae bacterium]